MVSLHCPFREESERVRDKYLVLGSSLLSEGENSWDTDGQMVATDEVDLSLLNEAPDLGLLEVIKLVLVGSSQMGNQASVVASDDDTTSTGGLNIIHTVLNSETSLCTGLPEDIGILVLANAADVEDRVLRENIL